MTPPPCQAPGGTRDYQVGFMNEVHSGPQLEFPRTGLPPLVEICRPASASISLQDQKEAAGQSLAAHHRSLEGSVVSKRIFISAGQLALDSHPAKLKPHQNFPKYLMRMHYFYKSKKKKINNNLKKSQLFKHEGKILIEGII